MYLLKFENCNDYNHDTLTLMVAVSESKDTLINLKKDLFRSILDFYKEWDNFVRENKNSQLSKSEESLKRNELISQFPLLVEYKCILKAYKRGKFSNDFFIEEVKFI